MHRLRSFFNRFLFVGIVLAVVIILTIVMLGLRYGFDSLSQPITNRAFIVSMFYLAASGIYFSMK